MTDTEKITLTERTPEARKAYLEGFTAGLNQAIESIDGYRRKPQRDEWDRGCNAMGEMVQKELKLYLASLQLVIEQEGEDADHD